MDCTIQASLSITNSQSLLKLMSMSWWCHKTISSSVIPFPLYLHSFPASGSFPVSQFSTEGGLSIGASASASVLPMNIQDWLPLGLAGLISWSPRASRESTPAQLESINSLALSPYGPTLILVRDYWKSNSFNYTTFIDLVAYFATTSHFQI